MAALSDNRVIKAKHLGDIHSLKVAGSTTIYSGGMVMIKSDGYAAPAAASASNKGVWGIAIEKVDNSSGSDGDKSVKVQEGTFLLAGTTLAQGSVGSKVYAEDDQTVDETQGTNEPVAGVLVGIESASEGWVKIGAPFHA